MAKLSELLRALGTRVIEDVVVENDAIIDCAKAAKELETALADYKGIFAATEAREREHGLRVELYFGCDTLEVMADEIIKLRAALAEALKAKEEAEKVSSLLARYLPAHIVISAKAEANRAGGGA